MKILEDAEDLIRGRFWHPQHGQVVVDIGSYFGTYTLPSLRAGATVISVEGREYLALALRDIAEAEGYGDRLHVVHATVFDGRGYPAELREEISRSPYDGTRRMIPTSTNCVTLDDLTENLSRLDWLKVDVEGGELALMQHGRETLEEFKPRVLVEDHSRIYDWTRDQDTTAGLRELLDEAGYAVDLICQQHVDYIVGVPK